MLSRSCWNDIVFVVKSPEYYGAHLGPRADDRRDAMVLETINAGRDRPVTAHDVVDALMNLRFAGTAYCDRAYGFAQRTGYSRYMRDARAQLEEALM